MKGYKGVEMWKFRKCCPLLLFMDLADAACLLNRASRPAGWRATSTGCLAPWDTSLTKSKTQGRSVNPHAAQELMYQKVPCEDLRTLQCRNSRQYYTAQCSMPERTLSGLPAAFQHSAEENLGFAHLTGILLTGASI